MPRDEFGNQEGEDDLDELGYPVKVEHRCSCDTLATNQQRCAYCAGERSDEIESRQREEPEV